MFEVFSNPLWLTLHTAQMARCGLHQLQFGTRRCQLRDGLFDIGIGHLVGVEFWTVAGQVKNLDGVGVLGQPGLDRLGMVHPQVVQNQEY
mgnify:CR=1 FL=1